MYEIIKRRIIGEGCITGCLPESCRGRNPKSLKATACVAAPGRLFTAEKSFVDFADLSPSTPTVLPNARAMCVSNAPDRNSPAARSAVNGMRDDAATFIGNDPKCDCNAARAARASRLGSECRGRARTRSACNTTNRPCPSSCPCPSSSITAKQSPSQFHITISHHNHTMIEIRDLGTR
jgi:hypothetical protein